MMGMLQATPTSQNEKVLDVCASIYGLLSGFAQVTEDLSIARGEQCCHWSLYFLSVVLVTVF